MEPTDTMSTKHLLPLIERYQDASLLNDEDEMCQKTIQKIQELNLQTNPVHYSIIYEWLSNLDPYFTDTVQTSLNSGSYGDYTAEALYRGLISKFLHQQMPNEEIEQLLNGLISHVDEWIIESQEKQINISSGLDTILQEELPPTAVNTLTNLVAPTLKALQEDTSSLKQMISESAFTIKKLQDELEQANLNAITDELTKIPNRRGFNDAIQEIIETTLQEQSTFVVILLDLDYFKLVNDQFGHVIGDSTLRYVAKLLNEEIKGRDYIARVGGEEFAVLLPNTTYDASLQVAENIRLRIANQLLRVKNQEHPLKLTVSAGVAIYRDHESVEQLLQRADDALYMAKDKGRNLVVGEKSLVQS